MRNTLVYGILSLIIAVDCSAEDAYQFDCELDRIIDGRAYKEKYKYIIKKDSDIAQRKMEAFKKENGKYINLIDLSDGYIKMEHQARQAWKTVDSTWTVKKLIFSHTASHRAKVAETIDRTSLQFEVGKSMVISGIKVDLEIERGYCNVSQINTKDRLF